MKKYFILFLYLLLVGADSGQVIQVNQSSGCVSADLSVSSLEQAVISSSPGDTIVVCPGTYPVNYGIVINKSLKIYGHKQGTVVVDLAKVSYSNNININSNGVEVKNLTVITSSPGNAKAFQIRGKNITIENVTIGDRFQHGFYIDTSENVTIRGVYVYEAEKAAIEIHDSFNITVEDSSFIQESTTSNLYTNKFIALYNVSNSNIINNNIYEVVNDKVNGYDSGYAIYINASSTGNTITGNFIRRVSYCIFFDDASSGNLFYNNYFDCGSPPCKDDQGGYNHYNISKTPGTNIVGGNYIKGNYWGGLLPYEGSDTNVDGIGDTNLPYNATKGTEYTYIQNGGDYGPLIKQRETSPPVIFSINLHPNYELNSCTLLNASVTSYNETIAGCTLYLDGQAFAMNLSQGSYISYCTYQLCPADFPQGYASYYIEAKDASNNTGFSEVRGLNINATPAVIYIISPANNAVYNSTELPLNVTSDKRITAWIYNLNSAGNVTFTPNTTINSTDGVVEGNNTLEVYAHDVAGYWVYSSVYFTVDLIPPAMQVISPKNSTMYTTRNITVNATASEAVTWRISLNDGENQNVTLPTNINASEGLNHLIIYATDIAGNTNSSGVYFTVDTTPPYAVPSTGNTKVDINSSYNLTWTLYDNVAGGYYRVLRNGSVIEDWQPWSSSNASNVTAPVDTSQLGAYNYTIEFNDSVGWVSSNEVIITVLDPNPPNITIISPENNTYYSETTILLNATSDRAVHIWLYSINGSTNNSFIPPENITITSGDGYYLLEIWANSTSGVFGRAQVYFYVDTAPPITTDNSPAGWQNAEFVISLIAQDNLSGVAYTSYKLDNQSWVNGTTVNITTEGNHTIEYYSVDNAGNVETVKRTYAALDKTPPVVNITSPLNRTYTAKEIPLNVTANEGISAWTYSLNNAGNVTLTPNSTITAQEGINHIVVYALDRAGNLASAEVYFSVDTTPPGRVSNLTATSGVRSIFLNWTNPEDVDFAGVEIWVNDETNAILNYTFTSFNIKGLLPATAYNISLRTFDAAGNRGNWSNITVTTLIEEKQIPPAGGGGGKTNKNRIEKVIKEANKGKYAFIMIEIQDIEEIAVKPKVDLYYAKIIIEFLDELPEYIEKPPVDRVYLVFKADFSTKAIEKAKIKFKVKKEWLKENNINPNKVKLLHYHAAKWEEFPAKNIGVDGEHYIYEAEFETFSYFVVTGEEGYVEGNTEGVELKKERKFDDFPMFGFSMGSNTEGGEESVSDGVENKSEVYVEIDEKTTATEHEESEVQVPDENTKGICGPGVIVLISLIPLLIFSRKKAA